MMDVCKDCRSASEFYAFGVICAFVGAMLTTLVFISLLGVKLC